MPIAGAGAAEAADGAEGGAAEGNPATPSWGTGSAVGGTAKEVGGGSTREGSTGLSKIRLDLLATAVVVVAELHTFEDISFPAVGASSIPVPRRDQNDER